MKRPSLAVIVALILGFVLVRSFSRPILEPGAELQARASRVLAGPTEETGELRSVVRVIDGDTLVLDGGERVRLIGVDTPETVHPNKPVARSLLENPASLSLWRLMELPRGPPGPLTLPFGPARLTWPATAPLRQSLDEGLAQQRATQEHVTHAQRQPDHGGRPGSNALLSPEQEMLHPCCKYGDPEESGLDRVDHPQLEIAGRERPRRPDAPRRDEVAGEVPQDGNAGEAHQP